MMPVQWRVPREPVPLWLAAGPALTALTMALLSGDEESRSGWSVLLLLASLALVTIVLLQRWWASR
jgi:hypothetical protein